MITFNQVSPFFLLLEKYLTLVLYKVLGIWKWSIWIANTDIKQEFHRLFLYTFMLK